MNLIINMATLRGSGTTNVGTNLLKEFVNSNSSHHFECWIPDSWRIGPDEYGSNISLHYCKKGALNKFINENIWMRNRLGHEADKLFSLGDTSLPFCHIPHLLMVQQPYLAYLPSEWDFKVPVRFRIKLSLLEYYFQAMLPSVSMVTVQNNDMKRRMSKRWNFPEEKIVVIPSSVNLPSDTFIEKLPDRGNPYICYIASSYPHKNHVILADVMASLAKRGFNLSCRLTVMPEDVPDLVKRARMLNVLDKFVFMGNLFNEQCMDLMSQAIALVMPSKLESFGLPYYEAMALGCPVIATDREFSREACASAGLYSDGDDGESFATHVINLLESEQYWQEMSEKVKHRFASAYFSWHDICQKYLNILQQI